MPGLCVSNLIVFHWCQYMHLFAQQRSQVCSACEGRMFDASSVQPKSGLCGKITVYSSYSNLMHVHDSIPRYGFTL